MTKRVVSNRQGYELWASTYDTYPNPTVACDDLFFPSEWKHLVGQNILEIGCGTGRHTLRLCVQGNKVVGIDLSPAMLAIATQKLQGFDFELIEHDFLSYQGFKSFSFDSVISSLVIEHVKDLKLFFSTMERVLKPGGMVFLSEIHPERAKLGSLAHFKNAITQEEVYLDSCVHRESDILEVARDNNFQLVRSLDIIGTSALANLNPKWNKYLNIPMIKILVFRKMS